MSWPQWNRHDDQAFPRQPQRLLGTVDTLTIAAKATVNLTETSASQKPKGYEGRGALHSLPYCHYPRACFRALFSYGQRYDNAFGDFAKEDKLLAGMDEFGQKAYQMMRSEKSRDAFDLSKEPESVARLFGGDQFSQSCLLATRLVQSGVRFVTVTCGGWDTHQNNWSTLKDKLCPQLDAGLSGLFLALAAKGLLDSTSVFVSGEFGRTPKINQRGGRDHYPRAMFCLLAGGGIKGGQDIGESDAKGETPKDKPITPDDVAATFYHTLGIDHTKEYHTPSGRPVMIVRYGKVLNELVG